MIAQARSDEAQARQQARAGGPATTQSQEGYWEYMQRQMAERTEKLGLMGDSVSKLEETSSGWADAAGKFVQKQKKQMIMGGKCTLRSNSIKHMLIPSKAVKGRFGL
jgi:syntaxin-binding protein 5